MVKGAYSIGDDASAGAVSVPSDQDFKSNNDYRAFAHSIARRSRYVFEPHVNDFIKNVIGTVGNRIYNVEGDSLLMRSQLGHEWQEVPVANFPGSDTVAMQCAYGTERMKPLRDSAREGRVNAKGIPCLYLSDDQNTAMAETRPWIGSYVSLAQFVILRKLRLVNCCDERINLLESARDPATIERMAWGEISHAFSEPVSPSDVTADYAPSQVLADLFRSNGYDGIRYKSLLGPGYNYALFDLDAADLLSCGLHQVKRVLIEFDITDDPYFNPKYKALAQQ